MLISFSKIDVAKILIIYWHDKKYSAKTMYQKLQARSVLTFPACSSITDWIRAFDQGEDISMRASGSGRSPDDRIDDDIAEELEISPFHSVHSLASAIKHLRETVRCHLHSMYFVVKHLRLVPHALRSDQ
jgi:hypothetical protein